jgi:hypothetical protein
VRNFHSDWPRLITASVAGLQAIALLGYALGISVIGLMSGLEGPAAVSSPTGAVVEVIAFGLFGAGLAAIALGRWRESGWSGPPFVLAQLLALTVGIPLVSASDSVGTAIGSLVTGSAILGIVGIVAGAFQSSGDVDLREQQQIPEHIADS